MGAAGGDRRGNGSAVRVLTAVGVAAAAHVLPAATWLPWPRQATPGLAGRGRSDHVALTFDDGPAAASTPAVLERLEALDVKATFFMLGERVAANPGLARRVACGGHEVAVHGWSHRYALGEPFPVAFRRLRRARDMIADATGREPTWFRPAYGVLTADAFLAARRAGLRPVLWTAWGRDWTSFASPESIMTSFGRGLRGGATLLLHDAHQGSPTSTMAVTASVLPLLRERCAQLGLLLGPLAEHDVCGLRTGAIQGRDALRNRQV
jgi:peptidoglycan-N-acetylglucosamine deacetylase